MLGPHPFLGEQRFRAAAGFSHAASGNWAAMILRDPQEFLSRRLALTMTDVIAMLVVFVAIVAILI
jgi:hypothetical protein